MHATVSKALRLEYDDVDELVKEVKAPAGGLNNDVMRVIDNRKREND